LRAADCRIEGDEERRIFWVTLEEIGSMERKAVFGLFEGEGDTSGPEMPSVGVAESDDGRSEE
jgi:hypothetical protein